jgi:hypothetical protein
MDYKALDDLHIAYSILCASTFARPSIVEYDNANARYSAVEKFGPDGIDSVAYPATDERVPRLVCRGVVEARVYERESWVERAEVQERVDVGG